MYSDSVIPFYSYSTDTKKYQSVGSAVLVSHRSQLFFITAAHVMESLQGKRRSYISSKPSTKSEDFLHIYLTAHSSRAGMMILSIWRPFPCRTDLLKMLFPINSSHSISIYLEIHLHHFFFRQLATPIKRTPRRLIERHEFPESFDPKASAIR